ncbi:MAG: PadR family transcriptional regulator [Acidimicrobiales bacterium]
MRNKEFEHSPHGRGRNAENSEGSPFEARSSERRRHGPRHGGGRGEGDRDRENFGRGGRGRGRRGDVRVAILALLEERPMHGYEMMQELSERTSRLWRPSPGSVYPALQMLEDQGLVRSESADGRRQYTLTDEGREHLKVHPHASAPWETMLRDADKGDMVLREDLRHVAVAVHQVAEAGTAEQKTRADALLKELRRQMYLLLAESLAPRDDV